MNEDVTKLQVLLDQLNELHRKFYDHISQVGDKMRARDTYDMSTLVDLGFLTNKTTKLLDDWRKDSNERRKFADRLICLAYTEFTLQHPDKATDKVQGTLASGDPDMEMEVNPPDPGQPGYDMLCRHFGIPETAIATGAFKFSWKQLSAYLTKCSQEGKPFPPGIGKPWPVHAVRYYAKGPKKKAPGKDF